MDCQFNAIAGQSTYHPIDDYLSDESNQTIIIGKSEYNSDDSEWTPNSKRKSKSIEDQEENDSSTEVCDSDESEWTENPKPKAKLNEKEKENILNSAEKRLKRDRFRRLRLKSVTDRLRDLVPNINEKTEFATLLETTADYLLHLSKCHKNKCDDFQFMINSKIVPKSSRRSRKSIKFEEQMKTEDNIDLKSEENIVIDVNQQMIQTFDTDFDSETVDIENNEIEEQISTVIEDLDRICAENDVNFELLTAETPEILPQISCDEELIQTIVTNTPKSKRKRKKKFQVKYKK